MRHSGQRVGAMQPSQRRLARLRPGLHLKSVVADDTSVGSAALSTKFRVLDSASSFISMTPSGWVVDSNSHGSSTCYVCTPATQNSVTGGIDDFQLLLRSITYPFTLFDQFVAVENLCTISFPLPYLVLGSSDRETEKPIVLNAFPANRLPVGIATC